MKKVFFAIAIVAAFAACNNASTKEGAVDSTKVDSVKVDTAAAPKVDSVKVDTAAKAVVDTAKKAK